MLKVKFTNSTLSFIFSKRAFIFPEMCVCGKQISGKWEFDGSGLIPRGTPIGKRTHGSVLGAQTHGETHRQNDTSLAGRPKDTNPYPWRDPYRGIHKGGRPPPFVEAARSAASFMDGCVGAGEAADAPETLVNVSKTCTCMHTRRATSDPQGHHGRAQSTGRADKVCFCASMKT